jgi:Zn-dependent metalloprotease
MHSSFCDVVSPHLLEALAASDDPDTRLLASKTLEHSSHIRDRRRRFLEEADKTRSIHHQNEESTPQGIVPDQLLEQVVDSSEADSSAKELAQKTLDMKQQVQDGSDPRLVTPGEQPSQPLHRREVYDMQNLEQRFGKKDETYRLLPGKLVRSEGQAPIEDELANQAYENCVRVLEFYRQVLDYRFLNGKAIISSVHFEKGYQNASWMGDKIQQMVYGDGGGDLYNFTACLDIIGHEMTVSVFQASSFSSDQPFHLLTNDHSTLSSNTPAPSATRENPVP